MLYCSCSFDQKDTMRMILRDQIRLDDRVVPHHRLVLMEIYAKCLVVTPTICNRPILTVLSVY